MFWLIHVVVSSYMKDYCDDKSWKKIYFWVVRSLLLLSLLKNWSHYRPSTEKHLFSSERKRNSHSKHKKIFLVQKYFLNKLFIIYSFEKFFWREFSFIPLKNSNKKNCPKE